MSKPTGSGYFAAAWGVLFLVALIMSFFVRVADIPPEWILRTWFLFLATVLGWWGVKRIRTGEAGTQTVVGQDTINFVVGIVGATIAILALHK